MRITINIKALRLSAYVAAIVVSAIVSAYSLFYIVSSHKTLVAWFTGLNNCFYRRDAWADHFFTDSVKANGNIYCIVAFAFSAAGLVYAGLKLRSAGRNNRSDRIIEVPQTDVVYSVVVVLICLVAWWWGHKIAHPAYDEIFSALDVAGINRCQGLAYYMLPNNHLLFNFLNGCIPFVTDSVLSGRVLSLVAYMVAMLVVFYWLSTLFKKRLLAFIVVVTLAIQFFTWAFSFQARGYELYLLAEWGAIVSMLSFLRTNSVSSARANAAWCVIGYCVIPSFLYWHLSVIVVVALTQLLQQNFAVRFWKYQIYAGIAVFFFYLPALTFSGLSAITNNGYVGPLRAAHSASGFLAWLFPYIHPYIQHIFSNAAVAGVDISNALLLLPALLLLFRRNRPAQLVGIFFVSMWLVTLAIVTVMRRPAFERNYIGHYGFTLAALLILAWAFFTWLSAKIKKPLLAPAFIFAVCAAVTTHSLFSNATMLRDVPYEYNVNETYADFQQGFRFINPPASAACSDEAFFVRYLLLQNGCTANSCINGNETYYVKKMEEKLPEIVGARYVKTTEVREYEVYKLADTATKISAPKPMP